MKTNYQKRRFMAFVLILTLIATYAMPLSVFAGTSSNTATVADAGGEKSIEDGAVKVSKTIEKTSNNNEFEITLKVQTKDKIVQKEVVNAGADIVLVIDTSGSMGDNNRTEKAQAAANTFVDEILGNGNPAGNKVALVSFAGNAEKKCDFTNSITKIKGAISQLGHSGGTNIQAGIIQAQTLLDTSKRSKYIVLLSDGAPTYSYETSGDGYVAKMHGGEIFDYGYLPYYNDAYKNSWNNDDVRNYNRDNEAKDYKITKFKSNSIMGDGTTYLSNDWAYSTKNTGSNKNKVYITNHGLPTISQAILAKESGINIYSVGCELADSLGPWGNDSTKSNAVSVLKNCANNADCYFDASDASQLASKFKTIAEQIILQTKAWTVTDPMGNMLNLNETVNEKGATSEGNTISWNLKSLAANPEVTKVDGVNSYVYTLKYKLTLDVANDAFVEDKVYDANGKTTLVYSIGEEGTTGYKVGTVDFKIPQVSGKAPVVDYSIEHYQKDGKTGEYQLQENDTYNGKAKIHTTVSVGAIESDYKTKYDNYSYTSGTEELKLGSLNAADNVLKLYYDPIPATVKVEHYYKTTTINADGSKDIENDYPATPQATESFTENLYKGESFTATPQAVYNGHKYTFVSSTGKTIELTAGLNTIKLYYDGTIDNRDNANYEVKRQYETGTYELNNGRYEKVYNPDGVATVYSSGTLKAYESVITSTTDDVTSGYTYNRFNGPTGTVYSDTENKITMPLSGGNNNLLVVFRSEGTDNRVPATIKVVHHYNLTETTIVNGAPVTTTHAFTKDTSMDGYYKNESFTPVEENTYKGDTYKSDDGNAAKCTAKTINDTNVQVDLYYNLTKTPNKAEVTVIHNYDEVIETSTTDGSIKKDHIYTSSSAIYPKEGDVLYVGQLFTADTVPDGYTFVRGDGDGSGALAGMQKTLVDGENIINLYYEKTTDNRGAANIIVRHTYITYVETIVDGKVTTERVRDNAAFTDTYDGKAGDKYTVKAITSPDPVPTNSAVYGNGEFKLTNESKAKVGEMELPEGTTTLELVYERNATDLKTTALKVIYKYINKIMTVINGVASYNDEATDGTVELTGTAIKVNNGSSLPANVYVGEKYTIDGNNMYDGKTYSEISGAHDVTLVGGGEDANTSTFVYERLTALPKTTVTVNQHYEQIDINEVGVSTTTTSEALGTPFEKYVGENAKAEAAIGDSSFVKVDVVGLDTADYTIGSDHAVNMAVSNSAVTVDYYFTKTNDLSKKATGQVIHHYQTKDYDGSRTEVTSHAVEIKGFATLSYTAEKHKNPGYDFEKAVTAETIRLVEGDGNKIDMYYVKSIDTREATSVNVIHNYYKHDTSGLVADTTSLPGILKGSKTETVTGFDNGIWVGKKYSATLQKTFGEGTDVTNYDFLNATPKDYTIEKLEKDGNTITINYIYNYDASQNVTMTINHVYNTYDSYTGNTTTDTEIVNAKYGDGSGTWNSVTHEFTANELNRTGFTRTTSDSDMTVVYNEGENSMTVIYSRTTNSAPSPGGGRDNRPGTGGNDNPTTIVDEDTPLTGEPVTETPLDETVATPADEPVIIEDEDTPLGNLPKTGGVAALVFYGLGAGCVAIGGRLRKEDDEERLENHE